MWAEKYSVSRQGFADLSECHRLAKTLEEVVDLPREVTTLKRQLMAQLPLLPQRHKMVTLNQDKLPTMAPAEKLGPRKERRADAH